MKFLDQARVSVKSGAGGGGAVSFHREKYIEFGGPDGGNGGRGGDVWVEAVSGLNTLIDYRYMQHYKAKIGVHGMGRNRNGAKGEDVVLKVPVGTQIYEEDNETLITDLTEEGQRYLLAEGGNGGFGNAHFKTSSNQAPRNANPGQPAVERWVWLRLKVIADVGLVGLPNAGKSTFLATVSAARPKIADYPFTTLHPNLGVARADARECVIADIPGLVEGANEGVGIGIRFLGHVERTRVLLHLVSGTEETEEDVVKAYKTVRKEMEAYGQGLTDKFEILALTKGDAIDEDQLKDKIKALKKASGQTPHVISAVTHDGVKELLHTIMDKLDALNALENPEDDGGRWTKTPLHVRTEDDTTTEG